ncbi:MAG: tripartite tricarboxylate transporter substrate binding protein, partial [Pseudomonadota bacterium]
MKPTLRRSPRAHGLVAALFCTLLACGISAQSYPSKPVRIIVPVGAGGATDILSRALAQRLSTFWGQQVVVDNRPGGGSNVGFEVAARAPADGYTLLMAQPAFTVNVSLYKKLPYHPLTDFSAVTLTATGANVLVVHPSVPAATLKDLIALARAKPGQLSYSSSGNGTTPHLSGELFKSMAGVNLLHVPYKGAAAAVTDLLGGHVDASFVSLSSALPQIKGRKLKALAVTSAHRSALMSELPTFAESGLRGYDVTGWYGIVAPAGTSKEIIDRLSTDFTRALASPDVVQTLSASGLEPVSRNTPEEFTAYL